MESTTPREIRLLLVDDDTALLQSLSSLFRFFRFNVTTAENGQVAWDLLQKSQFDIVLTDIRMPKMSGFSLLQKIRERDPVQPKVMMSSGFADYSLEDLYANGVDGFFSKPFASAFVRDCLNQSLLNPRERWAKPHGRVGLPIIEREFNSFKEASSAHDFALGRSGFFVGSQGEKLKIGDWVDFEIKFAQSIPFSTFTGSGIVQWTRPVKGTNGPPGFGVEIQHLKEPTLGKYVDWLRTHSGIANIPRS